MMKSMVASSSSDKRIVSDVLKIGIQAKEAAALNPNTVNGTLGMLYEENGDFTVFKSVTDVYKSLEFDKFLPYSSISGGDDFKNALAKWIFRQYYEYYSENFNFASVATPGGSGAISSSIANYLNPGDTVLIPSYNWSIYKIMAREQNMTTTDYNLFKDGEFDLADFEAQVRKCAKEQGRVLAIINDPCHNPTGYAMSRNEWEKVVSLFSELVDSGIPAVIIYDQAYVDYHANGLDDSRMVFDVFKNASNDLLMIVAFSASKSLSFYGMRLGAMFAVSKNADIINEFMTVLQFSSRGRWSSVNHAAIKTFVTLMNDSEKLAVFENELVESAKLLAIRGTMFAKEAEECGLEILPYSSGYFVTVPHCSYELFEYLTSKDIYTIPMANNHIRIAICSIPTRQIKGLAKVIKDAISHVNNA